MNTEIVQLFSYQGQQVRTVIIDGEPWFVVKDVEALKALPVSPSPYCGYIYAVEYGTSIKIGRTQKPHRRLKAIVAQASNYAGPQTGAMIVSPPHTNFLENERLLHEHFRAEREKGELFRLTLEQFLQDMPKLQFLDETDRLSVKTEGSVRFLKSMLFGGGV